jgi:hypothetical protein
MHVADKLTPLAVLPTSTRIIAGDVTENFFAYLCNGPDHGRYLELHVYPIPGGSSDIPEGGIVLHLKGFGASVSMCFVQMFLLLLIDDSIARDISWVPASLSLMKTISC